MSVCAANGKGFQGKKNPWRVGQCANSFYRRLFQEDLLQVPGSGERRLSKADQHHEVARVSCSATPCITALPAGSWGQSIGSFLQGGNGRAVGAEASKGQGGKKSQILTLPQPWLRNVKEKKEKEKEMASHLSKVQRRPDSQARIQQTRVYFLPHLPACLPFTDIFRASTVCQVCAGNLQCSRREPVKQLLSYHTGKQSEQWLRHGVGSQTDKVVKSRSITCQLCKLCEPQFPCL